MQAPGRRIVVVGTSGSGKTTLAQALAERLGVSYICNDAIIHGPNWIPTPGPVRFARFDEATRSHAWTFDGNVESSAKPECRLVLERADTIVWLDLPRWTVHGQVLRRTIKRAWTREPLWHGNRESFRLAFCSRDSILWWSIKTYRKRKRQYAAIFADPNFDHLCKIRLCSRREVNHWLREVGAR